MGKEHLGAFSRSFFHLPCTKFWGNHGAGVTASPGSTAVLCQDWCYMYEGYKCLGDVSSILSGSGSWSALCHGRWCVGSWVQWLTRKFLKFRREALPFRLFEMWGIWGKFLLQCGVGGGGHPVRIWWPPSQKVLEGLFAKGSWRVLM